MPDLQAYLHRIGFQGTPRPDRGTLVELHRRHLLSIPYENLDVQLGRPVSLDLDPIYEKLVPGRRGGWCYEMNGLFGWALEQIGFSLTRLGAGVGRALTGNAAVGNHLALRIHLDEPYLADVGFGDGIFEPVPIRPGPFQQRGFAFRLEELSDGWWRIHNHPRGSAPSFDFNADPCDRSLMDRKCAYLQMSPQSSFTQVAVVQRHVPEGIVVLRGRILRIIEGEGVTERVIEDRADYERVLDDVFGLAVPHMDVLWPKVEGQHLAFLHNQASGSPVTPTARPARAL